MSLKISLELEQVQGYRKQESSMALEIFILSIESRAKQG